MPRLTVLLVFLTVASSARAADEASLPADFAGEILPFCLTELAHGELVTFDGARLTYAERRVPEPRGALVLVPGRGDPFLKLCEVVYDLRDEGYDIYLYDHRGHGFSQRVLANPYKVHVVDFDDYVDDLDAFLAHVVEPAGHARTVVLAHSMGGAIATLFAERHPGRLDALVLSAPMHAVGTLGIPEPLAYLTADKLTLFGQGTAYAPSQGPPDPGATFAANRDTHSQARWDAFRTLVAAFPELERGQSTNRWLREALRAAREIRAFAWRLSLPVLLFQAEDDAYVENWGQDWVCALASDCELRRLPGSFHQLLVERDEIRDAVLDGVREML